MSVERLLADGTCGSLEEVQAKVTTEVNLDQEDRGEWIELQNSGELFDGLVEAPPSSAANLQMPMGIRQTLETKKKEALLRKHMMVCNRFLCIEPYRSPNPSP